MTFAPRTWVVGETVSAVMLNQEIRDQFNSMFAAWTVYAPTWTASTNPSLGNGTLNGRYFKLGRLVVAEVTLFPGSTTTYGSGSWAFSLPVTSATKSTTSLVLARMFDQSASANYPGSGQIGSNDTAARFIAAAGNTANVSATSPFTWAAGDECRITMVYESAS
ncbi:hypothetical protein L0F81_00330 [Streptomyces tricolor]|uniref:Uncharacterized protein n=1 Tax=Streptomyces tricolor TaxID=68277 RepID=A0ABS9J865_9ACTN|nr:hypothetical protein [Streptomyces tricolor]MCG0061746.1 hypothetical protein [Streptomyces tricolor]